MNRFGGLAAQMPVYAGIFTIALFAFALTEGLASTVSVIGSLYPVTTVILAAVFLHERVTRMHAIGIALAATAIACIAIGSSLAPSSPATRSPLTAWSSRAPRPWTNRW